jgi:hypothetical protein
MKTLPDGFLWEDFLRSVASSQGGRVDEIARIRNVPDHHDPCVTNHEKWKTADE